MKTKWVERKELVNTAITKIKKVNIVLDIGCGIRPQEIIQPKIHICCDPYLPYINFLQKANERVINKKNYIFINTTWDEAIKIFPEKSVDSVFLTDVIEHLEKKEGKKLLKLTEKIVKRQIIIFTPLGLTHQSTLDGKDAWGFQGSYWQEHRSGWIPTDFDDSWEIYACKAFHKVDNVGKKLITPYGAFYAIKTYPNKNILILYMQDLANIFHKNCKKIMGKSKYLFIRILNNL